ncbi:alpha/beta fold hydrolase [Streptomyces sp. NPDC087866]|uniref:alpha/beta fold hydrolase n=1 Tax=unclassified Streptomyces TaxID=2593676 RepID=UPI00224FD49F|nr:alpha/beta hydrolase [Streptomyces sp. NBC_01789]MCX4446999.1 alpha/beta hydrolase [Streptomyces sp. NBC_01789]
MSRPPTFIPPSCARARALPTARGEFAVLDAAPSGALRGTALLVPGYTGSKEDFIALLQPLADAGYRAVAVDGRGQFESTGSDDPGVYAQDQLARDVLAQAAALGDGAVHLVGHSLGGQIGRAAVLLDAAAFRSLTLMSSGPAEVVEEQQVKLKILGDALATMTMDDVWAAMRAFDPPAEADTDGEGLRRRWLLHHPAQLIATGRQLATEPDRVAEVVATGLPVHVVSGEADDVWPVPVLDEMAVRLGALRTRIEGAEHSPNTDRPQETAEALVAFWEGL